MSVTRMAITVFSAVLLLIAPVGGTAASDQVEEGVVTAASQGGVTIEWFGNMFFRLISPNGVVVLTSPWVTGPDSPLTLDDITQAHIILVPDAHGDDMGQAFEIAAKTGATVVAPRILGRSLIERGLSQQQVVATQIGAPLERQGIRIMPLESKHDNTFQNANGEQVDGSPALSYMITFENGFIVYFGASSFVTMDMQLHGMMYQPHLALISMQHGAMEAAHSARLLQAQNPNAMTVIPTHMRAGDPVVGRFRAEIDRLGVPVSIIEPAIGEMHHL